MDFDDYKRFVTNQKPLSVFNDMMKHFVEKCLCREDEEKLFRISLPLRSYFPSNDDEDLIDSEKI